MTPTEAMREAAAKVAEDYGAGSLAAAIRALPLPEPSSGEAGRYVNWNEPLCTTPDFVSSYVARALDTEIIKAQKGNFPERNYTDEDALHDFMVVHWAWFDAASPAPDGEGWQQIAERDREHAQIIITSMDRENKITRARIAELEGALKPFAVLADLLDATGAKMGVTAADDDSAHFNMSHGVFRRARSALAEGGKP